MPPSKGIFIKIGNKELFSILKTIPRCLQSYSGHVSILATLTSDKSTTWHSWSIRATLTNYYIVHITSIFMKRQPIILIQTTNRPPLNSKIWMHMLVSGSIRTSISPAVAATCLHPNGPSFHFTLECIDCHKRIHDGARISLLPQGSMISRKMINSFLLSEILTCLYSNVIISCRGCWEYTKEKHAGNQNSKLTLLCHTGKALLAWAGLLTGDRMRKSEFAQSMKDRSDFVTKLSEVASWKLPEDVLFVNWCWVYKELSFFFANHAWLLLWFHPLPLDIPDIHPFC